MVPLLLLACTIGCFAIASHFDRAMAVLPQRCPKDDQEMEVYKGLDDFLMAAGKVAAAFVVGEAVGSAGEAAGMSSAGAAGNRAGDAMFESDGKHFNAPRNWKCKHCGYRMKSAPIVIRDPTDEFLQKAFLWGGMLLNLAFWYSLFRWFTSS